jgi:dihydrofolate reductase
MARIVYYAAVSIDGFIADRNGNVGWLEPFNAPELGYEEFLARVQAVVLGRATYEQSMTFGPWPYPGRRGLIVTTQPISAPPDQTRAVTPAELPAALAQLEAETEGVIWIVGGGRTARLCLTAGLVDELELYVVPCLLGAGIPLLEPSRAAVQLRLVSTRTFANSVTMLRYAVGHSFPSVP